MKSQCRERLCLFALVAIVMTSALHARPADPRQAGWLGIGFSCQQTDGRPWLLVAALEPGGPAERAGLRVQDVIVAIDGRPISFANELLATAFFLDMTPRRTVRFSVVRQNRRIVLPITTAPLPPRYYERWKVRAEYISKQLNKKQK